jgi:nucleotide-binding universal stress UspA family protein
VPRGNPVEAFKNILVYVDGSEASLHALREALRLARAGKSNIVAVSVAPPYQGDLRFTGLGNVKALLKQPCDTALAEAMKLAEAEGFSLRTACLEGEPHEEIVDRAEAEGCDLIVMGIGSESMERLFVMGSTTARVIGYSQSDVLVVPEKTTVGWHNLLLATDGSKHSQRATERALTIAKANGAELNIVSATDFACELYAHAPELGEDLIRKARKNVEAGEKQADVMEVKTECFVREGEAYKAIVDLAGEKNAQMIIIGSHGETGLKRLLMGSVVEKVIGHSPCPVVVVKNSI